MTKKEYYLHALVGEGDWSAYLLENSRLPGPRANLELMEAYVELGSEKDFIPLLDYTPDLAPENTPEEFLAFCGTVGLGELIANGLREYLPELRKQASDPRWRIREAVARALQLLDQITQLLSGVENRKSEDFKILRKGLGYCWSVAVVANPEFGKPSFEKLFELDDGDVRWIIRENLKKTRMVNMDPSWVHAHSARLK